MGIEQVRAEEALWKWKSDRPTESNVEHITLLATGNAEYARKEAEGFRREMKK